MVTKTKAGWTVEYTGCNSDGMLISGAIRGRKVLYKHDTLAKHGIDASADPDGNYNQAVSNVEYLQHQVLPDKVIRRGYKVV